MCWKQQEKEVCCLLYSESKGVTQDGIEELLVDYELRADDPPSYYQETHYLDNSQGHSSLRQPP